VLHGFAHPWHTLDLHRQIETAGADQCFVRRDLLQRVDAQDVDHRTLRHWRRPRGGSPRRFEQRVECRNGRRDIAHCPDRLVQEGTRVVPRRRHADPLHQEVRVTLVPQADVVGARLDQPDGGVHILERRDGYHRAAVEATRCTAADARQVVVFLPQVKQQGVVFELAIAGDQLLERLQTHPLALRAVVRGQRSCQPFGKGALGFQQ